MSKSMTFVHDETYNKLGRYCELKSVFVIIVFYGGKHPVRRIFEKIRLTVYLEHLIRLPNSENLV